MLLEKRAASPIVQSKIRDPRNNHLLYARREGDMKTAASSVAVYERRRLGDERLLREIADYSGVDCRSTLLLRRAAKALLLKPRDQD